MENKELELAKFLDERRLNHEILKSNDLPPDISDPVLLISDYKPLYMHQKYPKFSYGLSLLDYFNGENSWPPKCWLPFLEEKIKPVGGRAPRFYEFYKYFDYNDIKYYPYSVNLKDFFVITDNKEQNIICLLNRLYNNCKIA